MGKIEIRCDRMNKYVNEIGLNKEKLSENWN